MTTSLIQTEPTSQYLQRYYHIFEGIKEAYTPRPEDLVVIENYSYSKRIAEIAELTGIIKLGLWKEMGISPSNIMVCSPTTLKKFVLGGARDVEKSKIMLKVYQKWQYEAPNDDLADAYALAKLGQYHLCPEKVQHEYEMECIASFRKQNDGLSKKKKKGKRRMT